MSQRTPPPGQGHEPEVVNDAPDDARGYNYRGWSVLRVVFAIFAVLVILASLLWVAQALGLLAELAGG